MKLAVFLVATGALVYAGRRKLDAICTPHPQFMAWLEEEMAAPWYYQAVEGDEL